jgi:hypothetical protein
MIKIQLYSSSMPQYNMRDLYNRQKKLQDWIGKVKTDLKDPDKTDILKLVEYMADKERSALWIVRYITALITIREQLRKPFRNATTDDMRSILKWMEERSYKSSTDEIEAIVMGQGTAAQRKKFYGGRYVHNDSLDPISKKQGYVRTLPHLPSPTLL